MPALSDRDVVALLAAIHATSETRSVEDFAHSCIEEVRGLVDSDIASYNEVEHGEMLSIMEPDLAFMVPGGARIIAEHASEHPLIMAVGRGDGYAQAISDFLTAEEFHALPIYQLVYGKMGVEDQLAIGLPALAPLVIGIALSRYRRGFSERDRLVMDLWRPHLAQAHRNARVLGEMANRAESFAVALQAEGKGVLLVGPGDRLDELTPGTAALLDASFAGAGPGRLPTEVAEWLRVENRRLVTSDGLPRLATALVSERGDRRITVRAVAAAAHLKRTQDTELHRSLDWRT